MQFLRGVGPGRARLLRGLGVETPEALLHYYPRAHEDRRRITPVGELAEGEIAVVRGRVARVLLQRIPGRRSRRPLSVVRVVVADGTGAFEAEWWNQPYRKDHFREGDDVVLSGKVVRRRGLRMSSPEVEILGRAGASGEPGEGVGGEEGDGDSFGRIVPLYPLTKGLRQRDLRRAVRSALDSHLAGLEDPLPPRLLAEVDLLPLRDAVSSIHFPPDPEAVERAKRRLRFDELLLLQLALAIRRRDLVREERGFAYNLGPELDRRIRARFPFTFTGAQDRAVADLNADFAAPHPMNRLLQGDVGCGKTALALYAMLVAVANGRQAALLAPTEILAEQHHAVFRRALEGSRVRIAALAGGMRKADRAAVVAGAAAGEVDVLVSTHAVLEGDVAFRDLGVAVVDEQHRFGVHQRRAFRDKGLRPDLLYLTATPIPRTLCLALFGDLDVTVVDERPPGRRPVITIAVPPSREGEACELVRREAAAGRQAFFVCPLVEESEELDLRAAEEEAVRLRTEVFPDLRVGLLHGRMKAAEKRRAMEEFRAGRTHVLVSTVVVEVGVDVPNASVLAVLHAERFGLSQLHQLRGRIGRGPHQSRCLLFSDAKGEEARARIQAMVDTDDGFRIAERDLALRGPGEFFGTRQSGLPDLRMPEALVEGALLDRARREAFAAIAADPLLEREEHRALRNALRVRFGDRMDLVRV
ncbi:MAG: ATP-dependent DNA helicase RecG [Planctomycetes bacterium]|nr:ATP-dependent DNA helicase RecG [Planctomycetota bacterium]